MLAIEPAGDVEDIEPVEVETIGATEAQVSPSAPPKTTTAGIRRRPPEFGGPSEKRFPSGDSRWSRPISEH